MLAVDCNFKKWNSVYVKILSCVTNKCNKCVAVYE